MYIFNINGENIRSYSEAFLFPSLKKKSVHGYSLYTSMHTRHFIVFETTHGAAGKRHPFGGPTMLVNPEILVTESPWHFAASRWRQTSPSRIATWTVLSRSLRLTSEDRCEDEKSKVQL